MDMQLKDELTHRHSDNRQTDVPTADQTDGETDRQTDTDRQIDEKTDRLAD
jgi:hypothetical protein